MSAHLEEDLREGRNVRDDETLILIVNNIHPNWQ